MNLQQSVLMASLLSSVFFFFVAISAVSARPAVDAVRAVTGLSAPPTCSRIECPEYDVIAVGNGYEIRRYNQTAWSSTPALENFSLVAATRLGFLQLFKYIQGKNEYCAKIEMTAPVLTQVTPSDGPFCASSFVVSFYVPKLYQGNPPPAKGIHTQKWGVKHVAVKQFGGFVSDDTIAQEAASLYASLSGSSWASAVDSSRKADPTSSYTVAQYNSPFEFTNRVNEIWMTLDIKDESTM